MENIAHELERQRNIVAGYQYNFFTLQEMYRRAVVLIGKMQPICINSEEEYATLLSLDEQCSEFFHCRAPLLVFLILP